MTLIKICGITNLPDALAALDAGADALGFNFYKASPRYIDPSNAQKIIKNVPDNILKVGVFVNEVLTEIRAIAKQTGINALQLHGDESPDYCAQLSGWYLIKALSVGEDFDVRRVLDYQVDAIMLDAKHKNLRGGTGNVIDWSLARQVTDQGARVFLAGGLSSENVQNALETAQPYAVDACSSLENTPGVKDHARMIAFVESVRAFNGK
jgi:phosphoribosylanthranilate isomerase